LGTEYFSTNEFIEFLPVTKWPLNFEEAIFCRGVRDKGQEAKRLETERDQLFRKVGQLQIEVDWLKKKTGLSGER